MDKEKTTENSEGDSKLAWKNLIDRFENESKARKVEVEKEIDEAKAKVRTRSGMPDVLDGM